MEEEKTTPKVKLDESNQKGLTADELSPSPAKTDILNAENANLKIKEIFCIKGYPIN